MKTYLVMQEPQSKEVLVVELTQETKGKLVKYIKPEYNPAEFEATDQNKAKDQAQKHYAAQKP